MTPSTLKDIPSWEWPPVAGESIKNVLRDPNSGSAERTAAAEIAGDLVVMDDEMADLLLAVLANPEEPEELRARAAIGLGPALEEAYTSGYDDESTQPTIGEEKYNQIRETLRDLFADHNLDKELRRRVLEASVRAPEEWHYDAIRAAAASDDDDWKLTATFGMRWVRGFEDEILEMLESTNPEIYYEAIRAAGEQGVEGAWPHIATILASPDSSKELLLAAIEAAPWVNREEASLVLADFLDSPDEDIAAVASDALANAEMAANPYDDDDEFDLENEDDEEDEEDPSR